MTHDQFTVLVSRLENEARSNPRGYQFKVLLLALRGFSVTGPFRFHSKKRAVKVLARIQRAVQFPGETMILNVEGDNYRFGRKFKWMRGARIL